MWKSLYCSVICYVLNIAVHYHFIAVSMLFHYSNFIDKNLPQSAKKIGAYITYALSLRYYFNLNIIHFQETSKSNSTKLYVQKPNASVSPTDSGKIKHQPCVTVNKFVFQSKIIFGVSFPVQVPCKYKRAYLIGNFNVKKFCLLGLWIVIKN